MEGGGGARRGDVTKKANGEGDGARASARKSIHLDVAASQ